MDPSTTEEPAVSDLLALDLDPPHRAWTRTAAARAALEGKRVPRCRLDVSYACRVALATHEVLLPMRALMATIATFDVADYDALPELSDALGHANMRLVTRDSTAWVLPKLLEELTPVRAALAFYVRSLETAGTLKSAVSPMLRGGNNYTQMSDDLNRLTSLLLERWAELEGQCPFTREQLLHASRSGLALGVGMELRAKPDGVAVALTADRDRAAKLLTTAYDQVRRVVVFLRWGKGDALELTPTLLRLGKRGGSKRKKKPAPVTQPSG